MFLIRTDRSVHGTACAHAALAYVKEMQAAGHHVVVTKLGGRPVTQSELRRVTQSAAVPTRH